MILVFVPSTQFRALSAKALAITITAYFLHLHLCVALLSESLQKKVNKYCLFTSFLLGEQRRTGYLCFLEHERVSCGFVFWLNYLTILYLAHEHRWNNLHFHRSRGFWSGEGCHVTDRNKSHTTCQCYHLTSFAVLMRVKDIRESTIMVSGNFFMDSKGLSTHGDITPWNVIIRVGEVLRRTNVSEWSFDNQSGKNLQNQVK